MSMNTTSWTKGAKVPGQHSWTDDVVIPAFLTHSSFFEKSMLAQMLFVKPGTGESRIRVDADPLALSTESVTRLVSEATREWMEENLQPSKTLDPQDYLFENPRPEAVPVAWLEALYSLPIHDDHGLTMDDEDE